MPFFADAQNTAERYGKYITGFEELFRASEISFGSPQDFFRLPPLLAHDEKFRGEFTELTKSVAKREDGRLSLTRMLTIVAMAMGGKEIANIGDEGAVPVSLVVVFLAGLGGWNESEPPPVASGGGPPEAVPERQDGTPAAPATESQIDDGREAKELEQRLAAGPEQNLEATTTSLFGGPAQVKEALSRLEMNTLQMKMHLDSIDSRMERIEPHLDDLKSKISAQPDAIERPTEPLEPIPVPEMKPWPRANEEAPRPEWSAAAPPMKPWPSEKEQDLVWEPKPGEKSSSARAAWSQPEETPEWRVPMQPTEPEPETFAPPLAAGRRTLAHGAAPLRAEPESRAAFAEPESRAAFDDDPTIRVPFDRYLAQEEEPRRGRRMAGAFAGILVMLAIIAGLLYSRHGWEGYHDFGHTAAAALASSKATVTAWIGTMRHSPSTSQTAPAEPRPLNTAQTPPAATPTPSAPPASTPPSTTQSSAIQSSAIQSGTSGASTPATSQSSPADARPTPAQAPQPHEAAAPAQANRENPASQPEVSVLAGSGVVADTSSLPPGMTTTVPIFVDEARLTAVSSPTPEYPRDAQAKRITGDVVVQAIVSRSGEVESAQIVSGPVGLLKASIDAARQWRFKPYMEHGAPAEVRTYIRFRYGTQSPQ